MNSSLIRTLTRGLLVSLLSSATLLPAYGGGAFDRPVILKRIKQEVAPVDEGHLFKVVTLFYVNVPSNGCVTAGDFALSSSESGDHVEVDVTQEVEDYCKGLFPKGQDLVLESETIPPNKKIIFKSKGLNQNLPVEFNGGGDR